MSLTGAVGGILFLPLLHNPVQAGQSVTLTWDPTPDPLVAGYKVYSGLASRNYTNQVDVGEATKATTGGLIEGTTYYFAVTAYSILGLESDFSDELSYKVPSSTAPPAITLVAPISGASFTSPATINLAANVTANGYTISKVRFYNDRTLLGEAAAAPYSFNWSNVSAGTYNLRARAFYGDGGRVLSSSTEVTVTGPPPAITLAAPWQTADIGSVGVAGSASMADGVYTVKGAGNISGTADNFRFVHQSLSGDGEIEVRLNSMEDTGTDRRIGIMIRESLTSGAKYALIFLLPEGTIRWQRRSNTGGSTSTSTSTLDTTPDTWLRLVRTGNTLSSYRSTDGTTWTLVMSSSSIIMATSIYVGLAVASGTSDTLTTATFDSVTVVP